MARRERELDLSERMSEHEALMWNIEKDPWLNPNGGSLTLLDQPVDMEHFRRQLRAGVAKMPRLYQRVVPGFARVSTPAWAPDPEFDLDYHLREVELPGPGTQRQLFDLAAQLYAEPLDRTRPLWRFVSIRGLEGGKGAIWALLHHVISDGIGQLRMAEMYQQLSRDEASQPEVDLEAVVAEAVASSTAKEVGGDTDASALDAARMSLGHLVRRQVGIGRRIAGEIVLWPADPERATHKATAIGRTAKSVINQLQSDDESEPTGSPLWTERSRHRHLEYVRVAVADLKAAGAAADASINDVFMAGLADGAHRYHAERDADVTSFNSSFVLSTRSDAKAGGNNFTPVPVRLPGGAMSPASRLKAVAEATTEARQAVESSGMGGITGLSGIINFLPTSVVTRTARAQAARIDFATSNLRGAPFELFCSGAKVEATVCMGPVAGTGANITALSYDGFFDIGLFIDPEAVAEPEALRRCIESAFADLGAPATTAEAPPKPKRTKPTTKTNKKKR